MGEKQNDALLRLVSDSSLKSLSPSMAGYRGPRRRDPLRWCKGLQRCRAAGLPEARAETRPDRNGARGALGPALGQEHSAHDARPGSAGGLWTHRGVGGYEVRRSPTELHAARGPAGARKSLVTDPAPAGREAGQNRAQGCTAGALHPLADGGGAGPAGVIGRDIGADSAALTCAELTSTPRLRTEKRRDAFPDGPGMARRHRTIFFASYHARRSAPAPAANPANARISA